MRYAVRINGLDALALTKLDVLDGLRDIKICTAYRCGGGTLTEFPTCPGQLSTCEPVYETLPGWSRPTSGARLYDDLPVEAQQYVRRLEEVSGVPVAIISTGSDREETIVRDLFARLATTYTWFQNPAGRPDGVPYKWLCTPSLADAACGMRRPPLGRRS